MVNKKMHPIDTIFFICIIIIGIISSLIDLYVWKDVEYGGFPVYSVMGVFISYAVWIFLLIYSNIKYTVRENKPHFVRWYMYFLLPFIYIPIMVLTYILGNNIINIIGLK